MNVQLSRLSGIFLALSSPLAATAQGLYWEAFASGGLLAERGVSTKNYGMPKMYKNEGEGTIMIFRLDRDKVFRLNVKEKTYTEMTFAELEARMKEAGAKMEAALEGMERRLKNLPKDQREVLEKLMEGKVPPRLGKGKVEVTPTAETRKILGYASTKFVAEQEGKPVLKAWVTKDIKEFEAMRKDWQEIQRRMLSMTPSAGRVFAEAVSRLDGFPLEMEVLGMKTQVTKVEIRAISPAEFEVPAGYTKRTEPEAGPKRVGEKAGPEDPGKAR